jgi:hypothetical protein
MIANMKSIPEQARPDLQVGGGDTRLVNVNNKSSGVEAKRCIWRCPKEKSCLDCSRSLCS